VSTCNCERCHPHLEALLDAMRTVGVDTHLVAHGADAAGMTVVAFVTQQLEGAARAVLDGRRSNPLLERYPCVEPTCNLDAVPGYLSCPAHGGGR